MLKHSDWNASRPQWSSNGVNMTKVYGAYSGVEREGSKEIIEINSNHLNDDDKYSGWGNINSNA